MPPGKNKLFVVPITTPVFSKEDNSLLRETDLEKNPDSGYLSSDMLNRVFGYLIEKIGNENKSLTNCYFLIASLTGEGENLSFDLWKSLVDNSLYFLDTNSILKSPEKLVIGILNRNITKQCIDYISSITNKKRKVKLLFSYSAIDEIISKKIIPPTDCEISFLLDLTHEAVPDSEVAAKMIAIRTMGFEIFFIKDGRRNSLNNENNIRSLKMHLPEIKVIEGWEECYESTGEFVDGGSFSVALIEPELIYNYTCQYTLEERKKHSTAIEKLVNKYASFKEKEWRYRLKEFYINRPSKLKYNETDFLKAWNLFFHNYSAEPIENIHVQKFNPFDPLLAMLKTYCSDLLSFQTNYFRFNKKNQLLFFPYSFSIKSAEAAQCWHIKEFGSLKTIFEKYFKNNYSIEEMILSKGEFFDNKNLFVRTDSFTKCIDDFDKNFKQVHFEYYFISEDRKDDVKIEMWYFVNLNLLSDIPNFVLRNIFQIAVFTKRNKDAVLDIQKQSTKSAIAAIMSRNMSHNIGSHVLSKLANLDSKKVEPLQKDYWIDQGKIFYNYLQRRMEFIADISTAETIVTNALFLQKDILNKFKTIGRGDDYPHFIADFISGVRELNRKSIHVKGFFKKDNEIYPLDKNNNLDPLIDLPNDSLGAQALYVMLENIIRNAAKHNKIESSLELNLYVEDSVVLPDYYEISIVDNQHQIHKEKYYKNETKINLPSIINSTIKKPILAKGKVRDSSWGILELKICAAYLAKEKLEDLDGINIRDQLLIQAAYFDDKGRVDSEFKHFNFGYKFWLRKPKLVLISTDNAREFTIKKNKKGNEENIEVKLNSMGVYFTDKLSIQKLIENGTEHEYLVIFSKKKNLSNQKIISFNSSQKKKLINILMSPSKSHTGVREFLIANYYPDYAVQNITSEFENVKRDKIKIVAGEDVFKGVPRLAMKTNKGNIIFDHHSEAFADNNLPKEVTFLEFCGSQSGTFEILSNAEKSSVGLNEICDAALKRVVVFDERIQENTTNEEKLNLSKANIIIPNANNEVDLMDQSFNEVKVESEINKQLKQSPHYFIIHLGVIEKYLKGTTEEEIRRWINKKIKLNKKDKARSIDERTKLIIISGRGKPPTLPDRTFYLPYSLVAQCILPANQASKLKLVQLLNKARRNERNRNNHN